MQKKSERTVIIELSRNDVVKALKAAHPDDLDIQAIDIFDANTTITMIPSGFVITRTHKVGSSSPYLLGACGRAEHTAPSDVEPPSVA